MNNVRKKHTVEDVARSIIVSATTREHYDEGLFDALGDVRAKTFRTTAELHPLSEQIGRLQFRYTTQLSALMDDEDIRRYVNDLDAAREECSIDEYELLRTIRFLHITACELLHWI